MDGKRVTQIWGPGSTDPQLKPLKLPTEGVKTSNRIQSTRLIKYPARQALPASSNRLSFKPSPDGEPASKRVRSKTSNVSATHYEEFLALDQAGPARIGSSNTQDCTLVAIKRRKLAKQKLMPTIVGLPCESIVNLLEISPVGGELRLVYELMDVSLRLVNSLPRLHWQPYEIAAICKEVVAGLAFLHGSGFYHGTVDCGSIMLNRDGKVKLANVGDCFLESRHINGEKEQQDVRAIGYLMVELMEVTTFALDPRSITIREPGRWAKGSGILDFLSKTQSLSRSDLAKHTFLDFDHLRSCLKPLVFTALIACSRQWEVLTKSTDKEESKSV